jgi:D-3-phosphoglycerate dehydrogenase
LIPNGHISLIYNLDKPGAIGSFATLLGKNNINIDQMQVGQEEGGELNIIFLKTNVSLPSHVVEEMHNLDLVKTVTPLEFDI